MRFSKILSLILFGHLFFPSCTSRDKFKRDLLSDDQNKIDRACYKLGEAKDTSAVKFLLIKILDPRRSTNLNSKGMSVNYCRFVALKKISGVDLGRQLDRFNVDTAATNFY